MRAFPLALSALLLVLLALPASAQQAIQQRMTPEQFKSAGLDKLSAEELAYLNRWLDGTLEQAATAAAEQARTRVESESRGFFNFGSTEPIVAKLQGEFRGFGKGRTYRLDNGHVWRQSDDARLAGVRLDSPQVTITPSLIGNAWYMQVDGYNTRAKVQREE